MSKKKYLNDVSSKGLTKAQIQGVAEVRLWPNDWPDADDILKCNEDVFMLIENSLELFQWVGRIDQKSALIYTMVWRHVDDTSHIWTNLNLICLHINASLV